MRGPRGSGTWCRSALCWMSVRTAPSVRASGHQASHLALEAGSGFLAFIACRCLSDIVILNTANTLGVSTVY